MQTAHLALPVRLQEVERVGHVQLACHVANDRDGNVGGVVEERAEEADGPQLQRATEVPAHEGLVLLVQVEETIELLGRRVTHEPAVSLLLLGGEEVDGQGRRSSTTNERGPVRRSAKKITFWRVRNAARGSRKNKGGRMAKRRGVFGGPLRAAIYARVSTTDQHTIPEQIRRLEEFAKRRGWKVATKVREVASGAATRPKRNELLAAAHRREIDAVLVWKLDRWGRSVADLVATLGELAALDVVFVSMTEAIDLSTPSGRALATMLATFAEFERDMLRERVRSGLERVRREGKRLGRPPTAALQAAKVKALRARHLTQAEIARRLKIGESSVRRILAK